MKIPDTEGLLFAVEELLRKHDTTFLYDSTGRVVACIARHELVVPHGPIYSVGHVKAGEKEEW